MSILGRKLRGLEGGRVAFMCPGCGELHQIPVSETHNPGRNWGYNGNPDAPTFTPSVFVRSGHFLPSHKPGAGCWCTYCAEDEADGDPGFSCKQCHSFVRNGHIEFLGDCSHALAGQTVELPDIEGWSP